MKTKSYTKYLGILLVIVSVFTLFFNWISAARYIKNLQKAASDSLGFFSDYSYTDALIEDAIDSLDDTLDDLRHSGQQSALCCEKGYPHFKNDQRFCVVALRCRADLRGCQQHSPHCGKIRDD